MKKKKPPQISVEQVVRDKLCLGCGFCSLPLKKSGLAAADEVSYSEKADGYIPIRHIKQPQSTESAGFVCPGVEVNMRELSSLVFDKQPDDLMLGNYINITAAYSNDQYIRENSASGGIVSSLLKHLFETKQIEFAYCAKSSPNFKEDKGEVIKNSLEIKDIFGSFYHPVNFGKELSSLDHTTGSFAFVGLPCEVAALRKLFESRKDLKERCKLVIGLFCGGINTFSGVNYYLNGFRIDLKSVKKINYRYGEWPGRIKLAFSNRADSREVPRIRGNSRWKILRYVISFQGYWMLKRCRLCPDQLADFADISVGDPHLPRFRKEKNFGYSAVITRTNLGEKFYNELKKSKMISEEVLSRDELIKSQGHTLDNRRHILAYVRVAKFLRLKIPNIINYRGLEEGVAFRHYVYAAVDLVKISLPKCKIIRLFYYPWQIFEYLFITFTPSLIVRRLKRLITNK